MPFDSQDIVNDEGAWDRLIALGHRTVPVTVIGDRILEGFDEAALRAALGLEVRARETCGPEALRERLDLVLEAGVGAIRQIPDDRLGWTPPGRRWTLAPEASHPFTRIDDAFRAIAEGALTNEIDDPDTWAAVGATLRTTAAVAAYAGEVHRRARGIVAGWTGEDLARPVDTYFGPHSREALLDIMLGHSAHHLLQVYDYLKGFGVEPAGPVTSNQLEAAGIPMLRRRLT